ncbi:MAG TPA: DUF5652 family protein [Nevskiaceae bacterium]|nr:DUF5652 family protein [Nevskiaceae bacterium]
MELPPFDFKTLVILVWSLAWKGWALWRGSKNDQKYWFIALLVLNTLGLLEIAYLVFFQKEGKFWGKIVQRKLIKSGS